MASTASAPSQETILDHTIGPASLDIPGMLIKAKKESGRSTLSIAKELSKFVLGKAKLTGDQYFAWRLYDDATFSPRQKSAFIGAIRSRRVNAAINTVENILGFIDNKMLFGAVMTANGLRYPRQVAVVSESRLPRSTGWLASKDEIVGFLRTTDSYPLFGKPIGSSSQSAGVISLAGYDAQTDCLVRHDGTTVPVERFAAEIFDFFGHGQYLFQERIFPHPEIEAACGSGLGTVRIVTVDEGSGPYPLYAAWKITATDAVADNFWRKGNLLANVDIATGRLDRVRTGGGFRFEEVETHPETGAQLLGRTLPDWSEAIEMVCDGHSLAKNVALLGWDLALSAEGPTIIEANTYPNHTLYQDASGKGVLSDDLLGGVHDRAVQRHEAITKQKKTRIRESNRRIRASKLDNVRDGLGKQT